ncbi:MAG: outer membrane beta-barrel family protein [Prevotellaceae bacterium]|nr:outer membrane beta-barrel family protein [Prevotellaceae bacterium]
MRKLLKKRLKPTANITKIILSQKKRTFGKNKVMRILLFFLFTWLSLLAQGQDRQVKPMISAKVVDRTNGLPIGWVSMWSYEGERQQVLKVSYAKPDGSLSWQAPKAGLYKLVFRADGYITDSLIVAVSADTTLSSIKLFPDLSMPSLRLEEAVVTAERPLLARLVDRYVYDVSRDPEAKRKKMTEIIEKIPGLNANTPTGALEYNGSGFQLILIDGERNAMINTSLQFPMRLIRADVMSKIEIIPAGSPQYNNDKPILNIITSRALPNGFAFEVSGDANTEQAYNEKLNFVSKIRDFAIVSFGYHLGYADRPKLHSYSTRELFNTTGPTGSQQSEGVSDGYSNNHNFRFGTSFKVFSNTLSINANTSLGENVGINKISTLFLDAAGVEKNLQTTESNNTTKTVPRLGLGADYGIMFPNKYRLRFRYTYFDSYSKSDYSTLTLQTLSGEQSRRRSETATGIKEHSTEIVLNPPANLTLAKHHLDAGIQLAHRQYDNLSDYWHWDDTTGDYAQYFDSNNGLSYTQRIANVNVSYRFVTKKFSLSIGAGGGYESNHGLFLNPTPSSLDFNYAKISPLANLAWKPGKNLLIGFRYYNTRTRPGVEKLNPYLDDSDPLNLRTGNPRLRPENSHTFLINPLPLFLLKYKIQMSPVVRYTTITNAVEQVTSVSTEGVGLISYSNLGRRNNLEISDMIFINMIKWITFGIFPSYKLITYKSSNPDVGSNTVQSLSIDLGVKFTPWKGGSITCSYRLQPVTTYAQVVKMNYYNDYSFYWQQTILKNKLFAAISLDNPFESSRFISNTITGSGFIYTTQREQRGRVFKLTLRANFGRFRERIAEQDNIFNDRVRTEGQSYNNL